MEASRNFWRSILLALLIALSVLSGCSGGLFGPPAEPVTLKFTFFERTADYEPLAAEFHRQHPNITVELVPLSFRGNATSALIEGISKADAARIPSTMVTPDMTALFLPLDTMISTGKNFPQSDLFPSSLDGLKLDGKQLGIPAGLNPFVIFYNPKKFQDAGVTPPPPDWTLEEFLTSAMAVNNPDEALQGTEKYTYGFCSHPEFTDAAIFTYLFGGGLFDSLTAITRPTLNTPQNAEALAWYASLRSDFGVMPAKASTRDVGTLIVRGNCGFWIDWLDRSNFGRFGNEDQTPTPLPLPSYKSAFNVATLDGYFLMAKSEHPEEAWQWITFLMKDQAAAGRLIPPVKTAIDSPEYAARVPRETVAVAKMLPQQTVILGMEMYRNERFGRVLVLFNQALNAIFDGSIDAQSALDAAQKEADSSFQ